MRQMGMTWIATAAFVTAVASACGGSGAGVPLGPGGGGEDSGVLDSTAPPSGFSGSSSGGFSSSAPDAGGSTPGSPHDCDPSCAAAGGTCGAGLCSITENPANAPAALQTQLKAGGPADAAFTWLYPYDRTVFARGIVSPTLQFGGTADTLAVHVTSTSLDYTGYFKPAQTAIAVALSQKAWQAVTAAVLGSDTVKVSVTKVAGGHVAGPIAESWRVAQGSLHGTVYHETYNSPLAGAVGIMRIEPGATQPTVLKSGCGNVCHTASADGSTLVADTTITTSASYDLRNNAAVIHAQSDDSFAYGGLYPDGSLLMSSTNYLGGINSMSQLYDVKTGATIAAPGWDGVITRGGTTAFSPDGKQIAFVHEDKDSGRTLAKMDFTLGTKTFSGLVDLATDPSSYLAWPSFTPDGESVVYHAGSNLSFAAGLNSTADLFIVDVATQTVRRLDALDGYSGAGSATYLPSKDPALNFTPTVLPEAVGGYFWVMFTSHRAYGNLLASMASGDTLGKLWVAAIDVNPAPGQDPSHPAFYLDGQELNADNLRGFWTLPPCQQNGTACTTGDQCCTGFCRASGGKLACVPTPTGCSQEYEKCKVAADCCAPGSQCINGLCAESGPR